MDSSFLSSGSEPLLDPAKCRLLSVNEKRELVRELSKSLHTALRLISKWSRREVMQILCIDLGRRIKFITLSKAGMLDHLFKVVNGKMRGHKKHPGKKSSPDLNSNKLQSPCEIQETNYNLAPLLVCSGSIDNAYHCKNLACRSALNPEDKFCRRCSCCICFKFDNNKDPSLWLFCTSGDFVQGDLCGSSCHLECALKDERSGILQSEQSKKLDVGYYCTRCGKENNLLGCWKKQLLIAKNARRLDELFYRIFLSHKILVSTEKFAVLHAIVDTAIKKLEAEIGPVTSILDVGHGIVGRFPVAVEVQKLCACALDTLESMFSSALTPATKTKRSCSPNCDEPISKSQKIKSVDLGETIAWMKKSPRVTISALHEEQEIHRPVAQSALTSGKPGDTGSKDGLSQPNLLANTSVHLDSSNLIPSNMGNLQNLNTDVALLENRSGAQTETAMAYPQQNHVSLVPVTEKEINEAGATSLKPKGGQIAGPSKPEAKPGNSSNKSPSVKLTVIGSRDVRSSEASYEYYIEVIRRLEREGHIEADFRMKFLTWFCLRATSHGRKTVSALVDNLNDDPVSLASQLVDTLSDTIYSKKPHPGPPSGFCMELVH